MGFPDLFEDAKPSVQNAKKLGKKIPVPTTNSPQLVTVPGTPPTPIECYLPSNRQYADQEPIFSYQDVSIPSEGHSDRRSNSPTLSSVSSSATTMASYSSPRCRSLHSSSISTSSDNEAFSDSSSWTPARTLSILGIIDPKRTEERRRELQKLLEEIYHDEATGRQRLEDSSGSSSKGHSSSSRYRTSMARLQLMSVERLREEVLRLRALCETRNEKLMQVMQRKAERADDLESHEQILTALLHAWSPKRRVDSRLRFSLDPPKTENGFEEWRNAMRAVARLQGGVPSHFRKKLWTTLATEHVESKKLDWSTVVQNAFADTILPEDDELTTQIIKDLHRTGHPGFDVDEQKAQLKQVLLGFARFNKDIGYCQGFNIIAAFILQTVDFHTESALKIMIFLVEQVLPSGYFDQSLKALSVDMAVLRDLLHQRLPTLIGHLEHLQNTSANEFEPPLTNVFSVHWLLCLFANCLPRSAVVRLWDAVMLDGSEVLLRAAIAIWARLSRKILKTTTVDEFYMLMERLSRDLTEMSPREEDNLFTVIYTMSEFPYPGLAQLRDKYTWNIQPLSSTFKVFQQSIRDILHDDVANACLPCSNESPRRDGTARKSDLHVLQKQYELIKQRQRQAAVILASAYRHGQSLAEGAGRKMARPVVGQPPLPTQGPAFNHLYVGQALAESGSTPSLQPPTTFTGGAIPLTSTIVQPVRNGNTRISRFREKILASKDLLDDLRARHKLDEVPEKADKTTNNEIRCLDECKPSAEPLNERTLLTPVFDSESSYDTNETSDVSCSSDYEEAISSPARSRSFHFNESSQPSTAVDKTTHPRKRLQRYCSASDLLGSFQISDEAQLPQDVHDPKITSDVFTVESPLFSPNDVPSSPESIPSPSLNTNETTVSAQKNTVEMPKKTTKNKLSKKDAEHRALMRKSRAILDSMGSLPPPRPPVLPTAHPPFPTVHILNR